VKRLDLRARLNLDVLSAFLTAGAVPKAVGRIISKTYGESAFRRTIGFAKRVTSGLAVLLLVVPIVASRVQVHALERGQPSSPIGRCRWSARRGRS
jgi:hypothetical protein